MKGSQSIISDQKLLNPKAPTSILKVKNSIKEGSQSRYNGETDKLTYNKIQPNATYLTKTDKN